MVKLEHIYVCIQYKYMHICTHTHIYTQRGRREWNGIVENMSRSFKA